MWSHPLAGAQMTTFHVPICTSNCPPPESYAEYQASRRNEHFCCQFLRELGAISVHIFFQICGESQQTIMVHRGRPTSGSPDEKLASGQDGGWEKGAERKTVGPPGRRKKKPGDHPVPLAKRPRYYNSSMVDYGSRREA